MRTLEAYLGSEKRTFGVGNSFVVALETELGAGIGVICKRLFAGLFGFDDIAKTIQLALIEGGTDPEQARNLIVAYVADRPIAETLPLAVTILEHLWFGEDKAND